MRIVGGTHRGTILAEVGDGDRAAHLRPTSDRVREALFNMLCQGRWGDLVRGQRVLDLFAGTGALGLESLSRGAEHVTLVDDGPAARALIRSNIAKLRAAGTVDHLRRDATILGVNQGPKAELVFLDPPYGKNLGEKALQAALKGGWIAPNATVVWEENTPQNPPPECELLDQRRYGETWITILRIV